MKPFPLLPRAVIAHRLDPIGVKARSMTGGPTSRGTDVRVNRRMTRTTRAGAAAGLIAALAVAVPVTAANADMPAVPPMSQLPATASLPPAAAAAAASALNDLPAVLPNATVPAAGQHVVGPTLVGDVTNGGVSAVIANSPPAGSGNVVSAP